MRLLAIIISFWSFILSSSSLYAATFYVDGAQADDARSGLSWANAKRYISSGVNLMSGGDILYIKDGIYQGSANRIYNVPSGSAGNYTRIYAENDWGVTISNPTDFPAYLNNSSYIEVRGVKFKDYTSLKVYVNSSNHIKIIRCSSDDNGGSSAGFLASNSSYVLFEECYKYGASRYAFQVSAGGGSSSYIIFRRCVVRWDYSDTIEPQACFANYDQSYVYFQNCIAIDGLDIRSQEVTYDGTKGFFTPNGANQTHFQGCIALNLEGAGYWIEDSPVVNVTLTNSVAWDCKNHANTATDGYPPRSFYSRPGSGPLTLNHCVFGQSNWTSRVVDSDLGAGDTLKNSIIANFSAMTDYAEDGFDTSIYNDYYGNSGGRNRNGGLGANSLTTNPFTNSLKYLTRIESGSDLSGQADDGGDIGATILKKIGVSGALYGEAGWDTVTSDNLWPFPNEDILRADMKAWSKAAGSAYAGSPAMSGDRGFCADGTTLTKYIWEYLGNAIPAEIYGGVQNNPPVLAAIGAKSIAEGSVLTFTLSASDADGDTLTYSSSNLPTGASFNVSSGVFSWTPGYDQAALYSGVRFSVSDGSLTDSEDITITVSNTNRSPALAAIGNKSVNENMALSFTVSATDPDSDTLTYSASGLPTGATFNASTRVFSWTPTYAQGGSYNLTFSVNDGNSATASETITITVSNLNRDPLLGAIGNKSTTENSNLTFTLSATDPDGDSLTYSSSNLPTGASFNVSSGVFSWTPGLAQAGSYPGVRFTVTDGNLSDSEDIAITVTNTNTPPVLAAIGAKSIAEGSVLTFTLSASDADGDTLTYSASNLPTGASFNVSSGVFSWTPGYDQAATYSGVRFSVSDGSLTDSEDITITVSNTNRSPALAAIGNKSVNENMALSFTVSATDPDSDTLTYSASGLPTGATFNASTRVFSWTPTYAQGGSYNLTFSVNDGNSATASETITITVSNLNRDPLLGAIGNKSTTENSNLTFTLSATDPDGDSLTYSSSNLPTGASFNVSSGVFSWTPGLAQAGSYPGVRFTVTDGNLSDSEDIAITVTNTNTPPVLAPIGAKSIAESSVLTFTLSASDADGDTLTYSASNLPTGASFNPNSRRFSWTSTYAQVGSYNVTFSVNDGNGGTASETVSITVSSVNRDPVLGAIGNKSVIENSALAFTLSATDPDGRQLNLFFKQPAHRSKL